MSVSTTVREVVPPVGQLVRAPKTAEIIARNIRRQIVSRELREGDTLPSEVELMAQFGVSRPTLREAFRILETESLISIRRGSRGGARVMAPSLSVAAGYVGLLLQMSGTTIGEVYDTRAIIEPAAAQLLAARRTQQDLDELREIIGELRSVVEVGDRDPSRLLTQGTALVWAFHDLMVQRAGNRALAIQWAVLRDVTETHLASAVTRTRDQAEVLESFRKSIRSYSRLVNLIEAKDAEGAARHWRKHLEVSAKILIGGSAESQTIVELFD